MRESDSRFLLLPPDIDTGRAHKAGIALGAFVRAQRPDVRNMRRDVETFVNQAYGGHPAKPLIRGGFLLGYLGMEKPTTDIAGHDLPRFH